MKNKERLIRCVESCVMLVLIIMLICVFIALMAVPGMAIAYCEFGTKYVVKGGAISVAIVLPIIVIIRSILKIIAQRKK